LTLSRLNQFVGESGDVVRLKSQGRNAKHDGSRHPGAGSISADAHYHVGIENLNDFAGCDNGQRESKERSHAREQAYILERPDFDLHQTKASLRDQTVLHAAGGAQEQYFRVIARFQFTRNGQRRDNVPAGATTSDENAHAL